MLEDSPIFSDSSDINMYVMWAFMTLRTSRSDFMRPALMTKPRGDVQESQSLRIFRTAYFSYYFVRIIGAPDTAHQSSGHFSYL